MRDRRSWVLASLAGVMVLASACSSRDTETRAREAAEQIKASIPDVVAHALEQKVNPADVKTAQEQLTKLSEYQGEINGELDAVTIDAIMAVQNSHGLKADGMLTEKTKRLLQEAAASAKAPS